MSRLTIWADTHPDTIKDSADDPDRIAHHLVALDVHFSRWPVQELPASADQAEVLTAYSSDIEALLPPCIGEIPRVQLFREFNLCKWQALFGTAPKSLAVL